MASNLHATAADLSHFHPLGPDPPYFLGVKGAVCWPTNASWPMNFAFYGNFLVILQFLRSELGIEFAEKLLDMHEP